MTPTAQYCDVILPGASTFQKEDIGTPWAGNYLLYKPRTLPMEGLERSDYDIFTELASRLGQEEAFTEGLSESGWIDRFLKDSEIKDIDAFKASGIYFGADQERCGLKDFTENPTGSPLRTASGKVELSGPRWRGWAEKPEGQPARWDFLLISPKEKLRVHSQWGDRPDEVRSGRLTMHEDDAKDLGLRDGDEVELYSTTGSTSYRLSLSADIARGVVSAFEGSWCAGADGQPLPGSPNYLTSTQGTQESVSCIMHGIPVEIRIPKA
jgi:anaerobic selenocysteine-containing dehydrogenase